MKVIQETLDWGAYLYGQALAALYSDEDMARFQPAWSEMNQAAEALDIAAESDGGHPQEPLDRAALGERVAAFCRAAEKLRVRAAEEGVSLGSYSHPRSERAAALLRGRVLSELMKAS